MKILVVSSLFPRDGDPLRGTFIYRQIRAVRDLGVDARVWCPIAWSKPGQGGAKLLGRDEWDGVPVRYFASWTVPVALSPALHGRLLLRTLHRASWHESHRPELYHAHWLFPTAWATIRLAMDSGIPVVATARGSDVHTYPVRSRRVRQLTRETMATATLVTAVSSALAQQARSLGPPGINVEVVRNGVDDHLFSPSPDPRETRRALGLSEKGFYWVSVCRLVPEKGSAELLGAFVRLAEQSTRAKLLLVGDGTDAASLKRRFTDLGLADRVVFAGRRRPEEVALWLKAANAFVLASHAEGLPNAVLEAMASGLPVVATDVGGTREAVLAGVSGLLVPPRDVGSLAQALARISEDPGLGATFGAEGRRRVVQYFGWEASARRWIDVYAKALRMSHSRVR